MNPREQLRRLQALQQIAGARRDAELARLSATAARLREAEAARDALSEAIAREIDFATGAGEVPVLQALDMHLVLAERARTALEGRIAAFAAAKEEARRTAAEAFGKATVLDRMGDKLAASRHKTD